VKGNTGAERAAEKQEQLKQRMKRASENEAKLEALIKRAKAEKKALALQADKAKVLGSLAEENADTDHISSGEEGEIVDIEN